MKIEKELPADLSATDEMLAGLMKRLCKCCGAPVDDGEYDDTGGYCNQCVIEAQEQRRLDVGL